MSNFEAYRQRNEEIYKEYLKLKNDPEKKMSDMEIAIVLSDKVWACGAKVTYIVEETMLGIIKNCKKNAEKIIS